ncbi:MAG: ABC transporter permease [Enterocloster bolteae]
MKEKILGMVKSTAGAVLIVTILMTVIVQLLTGHFYTAYNLSTFSRSASFTIIIGFAQTLVLLLGGIDLSVASVAGLCSMIFAMLTTVGGVNPFLSIAIALMAGVALGAINGIFICSLNLTPFIVTLATSALYKGIIYVATKGIPLTGIPESVTIIGQGTLFGIIPYPAIIMVVLAVILIYMLRYTSFGRHIYAVGGNEHAAKIVGIQINKTKMAVYALTGFISALAGILMVLRLGSSQVNIGENWAMPSITAGVLGGTSMNGGSGGIGGTIVGGLLMSVISFSISLLGISSYWDQIVTGVVVLIAIAIDAIRRRNNSNV